MRKGSNGFTLTELMIVVVIAAILAAVAMPAYQNYAREAARADAQATLLTLANAQEKQFTAGSTYVNDLALLGRTATEERLPQPRSLHQSLAGILHRLQSTQLVLQRRRHFVA